MLSSKVRISLLAALIFFIVANPETYKVIRGVLGDWVASPTGCPTTNGLILHTIVYLVITYFLMKGHHREPLEGDANAANANAAKANAANANAANAANAANTAPGPQPINSASNKMSSITGANLDGNSSFSSTVETSSAMIDAAQPINTTAPSAPSAPVDMTHMLSGSSWKKCGCEDGGQVLVLK